MSRTLIVLIAIVGVVRQLPAQEKLKPRELTTNFGFLSSAGNTDVTSLDVSEKFLLRSSNNTVIFTQTFGAVRSEADGVKNAENYRAQLRLDYGLTQAIYLFGLLGWDRNRPAAISRRFEQTVGVSYMAIRRPRDQLAFEVGVSMFEQRNLVDVGDPIDDNYTAGRLGSRFKHMFRTTSYVSQSVELIPNFDNSDDFRLNSETAFVAPISTHVGLRLGYVIQFDNFPELKPGGALGERLKKTDRFLTAGVSVTY